MDRECLILFPYLHETMPVERFARLTVKFVKIGEDVLKL